VSDGVAKAMKRLGEREMSAVVGITSRGALRHALRAFPGVAEAAAVAAAAPWGSLARKGPKAPLTSPAAGQPVRQHEQQEQQAEVPRQAQQVQQATAPLTAPASQAAAAAHEAAAAAMAGGLGVGDGGKADSGEETVSES
jgi:hypothetical protein